jgi:Uma2 family endonuclease
MSVSALPPWNIYQPPPVPVRRFTVEEYHLMGRVGVLTEDDRVELLEGWIVPKMMHNPRHDATIDQAQELIRQQLPAPWRIRIQSAITTLDSEPEPDLAVVLGPASRYVSRHPGPGDIALVIEVADASLSDDRTVKARLYARAKIPAYWIINLVDAQVEVYSEPSTDASSPSYQHKQLFRTKDEVPLTIDGKEIGRILVSDLLGSPSSET